MRKIVFASHNEGKISEMRRLMKDFEVLSLNDIGCTEDIPETEDTLEGNALLKARYVREKYGYDCFSDDSGLFVRYLNGAPGVYTARYAGEDKDNLANMKKLLGELVDVEDREASFKSVVVLVTDKGEQIFPGELKGKISLYMSGNNGFGYDPVFIPLGFNKTLAELTPEEKLSFGCRFEAINSMVKYLKDDIKMD